MTGNLWGFNCIRGTQEYDWLVALSFVLLLIQPYYYSTPCQRPVKAIESRRKDSRVERENLGWPKRRDKAGTCERHQASAETGKSRFLFGIMFGCLFRVGLSDVHPSNSIRFDDGYVESRDGFSFRAVPGPSVHSVEVPAKQTLVTLST